MKIFRKEIDEKHFCVKYYLFNFFILKRTDCKSMYVQFRKYQDIARSAYKLLCFCDIKYCKKATGNLRKNQLRMTDILCKFDEFARKNKITYWIDFGTLLGAYRHKGFIPWDHDVDICMLRSDLYKNYKKIKEFIEENTELILKEHPHRYNYFAQFGSKDGVLGLDIFTLDVAKSDDSADQISGKIRNIRSIIKEYIDENKINDSNYQIAIPTILKENFVCNSSEREIVFYSPDVGHPMNNLVISKEDVFPLKEIEFEGHYFYCPNNYKKNLIQIYGDVDQFPPLFMDYEGVNDYRYGSFEYPSGVSKEYSTDVDTRYNSK